MARLWTTPINVRRLRLLAGAALILLAVLFGCSIHREIGLKTSGGWMVGVGDFCLQIGFNPERFEYAEEGALFSPVGGGLYWIQSWRPDWTLAWRPFRVSVPPAEMVVIPLWPGVLIATGVFGWSCGWLGGLRRSRGRDCLCCGYDLSRTPIAGGARKCPECGTARPEAS